MRFLFQNRKYKILMMFLVWDILSITAVDKKFLSRTTIETEFEVEEEANFRRKTIDYSYFFRKISPFVKKCIFFLVRHGDYFQITNEIASMVRTSNMWYFYIYFFKVTEILLFLFYRWQTCFAYFFQLSSDFHRKSSRTVTSLFLLQRNFLHKNTILFLFFLLRTLPNVFNKCISETLIDC